MNALECQEITNVTDSSRKLTAEELTKFRSALGGLLWLTATRLDLTAEVSILQGKVSKATVGDMLNANALIKKAKQKQYNGLGLVYRHFPTTLPWRLLAIHDASAAARGRNYAQEGVIILLAPDHLQLDRRVHTISGDEVNEELFGGVAHILFAHGSKAKRICYSTSHAETLAAISGLETSTLVSLRMAEILMTERKPTLQQLAALQEHGVSYLPVDAYTDCRDFFSLTTGSSVLPQDKSQRIYILAHREARVNGRIRWMILVPTEWMTADALTKVMISKPLLNLMSGGFVQFMNKDNHPIQSRRLPMIEEFTEEELETGDKSWIEKKNHLSVEMIQAIQNHTTSWTSSTSSTRRPTSSNMLLLALFCLAGAASGGHEEDEEAQCSAYAYGMNGQFRAQAFVISVMTLVIFFLAYFVYETKRSLDKLKGDVHRQIEEVINPILYRVMDLECHESVHQEGMDFLRREAAEARGDIGTLFRAVRYASPHPDEPEHQRRRLRDSRPPTSEPDQEHRSLEDSPEPGSETVESEDDIDRLVNLARRSRSRDEPPSPPHDVYGDDEEEAFPQYADLDADDQNELERQRQEHNLRMHYMLVQTNNLGVYLHTAGQRYSRGRIPFGRVEQLYVEHAPFLPLPSSNPEVEDITMVYADDEYHYVWRYGQEQPLNFQSLEGLHGYRCHYLVTEMDYRLTPADRRMRLYNQLQHFQRI